MSTSGRRFHRSGMLCVHVYRSLLVGYACVFTAMGARALKRCPSGPRSERQRPPQETFLDRPHGAVVRLCATGGVGNERPEVSGRAEHLTGFVALKASGIEDHRCFSGRDPRRTAACGPELWFRKFGRYRVSSHGLRRSHWQRRSSGGGRAAPTRRGQVNMQIGCVILGWV